MVIRKGDDRMLEVQGITKSFGGLPVLNGVDLSVHKGDVAVILGPSGSGKTTLLRCMNYLERSDEGLMRFDNVVYQMNCISKADIAGIRRKTAFVFQDYNLFRNKTVLENVTEGLIVARKMPKRMADKIGGQVLEKVGMSPYKDYYPQQLSGGQQQRVAIARALATSPEIIFFDEPTSALDPELTEEVLAVIKRLAGEGMTMLIVTHEMDFARQVATQVIFMEQGFVVEKGSAEHIFTSPIHARTRRFLQLTGRQANVQCLAN